MSNLRNIAGSQFVAKLVRLPSEEFKDAGSDQECIICQAEFGPETDDVVQLPCGHVFDRKCLNGWLSELEAGRNTCPKCRAELFVKSDTADSDTSDTDTIDSDVADFLAEYANSRTPFVPPEEDITEFLDQISGIPASVAARLPPPSATLALFSGLSENATRVLRQQYSNWFARQTQEIKDRFPNPSDLPIQPRDDSVHEPGHNYGLAVFQQREEEDVEEGVERVLRGIPGLTEVHLNEFRRARAESQAQRQRPAGVGFEAYHADSSNASHNIPQARANENHNMVETDDQNNATLRAADGRRSLFGRSATSGEGRNRLPRNYAELRARLQRH